MLNGKERLHIDHGGNQVGDASVEEIAAYVSKFNMQPSIVNAIAATAGAVIPAADIAGAQEAYVTRSGPTANFTDTTDTAANIIAALPQNVQSGGALGTTWTMRIVNNSGFTETVQGGTGVTVTGTATLATNTFRDFVVKVTSIGASAAVSLTSVGSGTN